MPTSSSSIPPHRLPAPSLFVAPPSRNASNLDLSHQPSQNTSASAGSKSQNSTNTIRLTPSAAIPGPTSPLQRTSSNTLNSRRNQNHSSSSNEYSPTPQDLDDTLGTSHFPPPPPDPTANNTPHLSRHPTAHLTPGTAAAAAAAAEQEQQRRRPRRSTAILDAHWAALQSTLSDIELSASGTSHVFGPAHAGKLEELRKAQVELARAWGAESAGASLMRVANGGMIGAKKEKEGRNSKDGAAASAASAASAAGDVATTTGGSGNGEKLARTDTQASRNTNASKRGGQSGHKTTPSMEKARQPGQAMAVSGKETEADLDAAEQRRKESDAYFKKVREGVDEVVRKLEGVSLAMREVEMESREIWGDGGSGSGSSSRSSDLDDTSLRS